MAIHPQARIGHVHLTVSDLDRALAFYRDALGFDVTTTYGRDAAVRRLRDQGVPLEGAADHGVSEAVYLRDPDGNGVELYRDRPENEWPRTPDGALSMHTRPLD